jgi:hypothetical protein
MKKTGSKKSRDTVPLNLYLCNLLPCSLWHTALYYSVYSPADLSFPQDRGEGITLSGYILYILPVINTPHLSLLYASFPVTHFFVSASFFSTGFKSYQNSEFFDTPMQSFRKNCFARITIIANFEVKRA